MKNTELKSTGARIKARRKEMGYSQEQFAAVMNTTKGTICKYENDTIDIKRSALIELADQLQVSVGYLVNGEENITSEEQKLLEIFRSIGSDAVRQVLVKQAMVLTKLD